MTFDDLRSFLRIRQRMAPSTIRKDVGLIQKFVLFCEVNNLSYKEAVEPFLEEQLQRVSKAQVNSYIKALKNFQKYLIERNLGEPFLDTIRYFKKERFNIEPLTRSEKDSIYLYEWDSDIKASNKKKSLYTHNLYKKFTLLLDMTGMRFEDASSLVCRSVRESSLVFNQIKTKQTVMIPIESPLKEVLQELVLGKSPDELVFKNFNGGEIIRTKYSSWLKKVGEAQEIKDYKERCHPHNFRRSYATELSQHGVDIRLIQGLMGHSQISTTANYVYPNEVQLRDSIKKLPLAKRHTTALDVFKDVLDAIRSFHLDEDGRFTYNLREENKKLMLELEVSE